MPSRADFGSSPIYEALSRDPRRAGEASGRGSPNLYSSRDFGTPRLYQVPRRDPRRAEGLLVLDNAQGELFRSNAASTRSRLPKRASITGVRSMPMLKHLDVATIYRM